jgi:hypothetical protein
MEQEGIDGQDAQPPIPQVLSSFTQAPSGDPPPDSDSPSILFTTDEETAALVSYSP